MDTVTLTKRVKDMAYALGADMVGIAPVSRFDGQPHMLHPRAHLPEARSVICLASTTPMPRWSGAASRTQTTRRPFRSA
ncbi:MAG: hypothetical protein J6T24_07685 [Clostridia bacterium]|nr:hypothetical protein [Clostridia bacterium]